MSIYIHEHKNWPNFSWKIEELVGLLSEARNLQGHVMGRMESLGFDLKNEALLETWTLDVLKSAEIEGELLNPEQVRSSIAKFLGLEYAGSIASDRNVEGMVQMMIDATQNCLKPLDSERLFDWHAGLFPMGRSGIFKITVADWRKDTNGKMQVVSGAAGREKIHFQAPDAHLIENEMNRFLEWFNNEDQIDLVIKAAIAHLWFNGQGQIQMEANYVPTSTAIQQIPKFGMRMQIPEKYETINWYGRGPVENYPDRRTGTMIGLYESKLENFITNYVAPQDNANRCDVRWCSFSEQNGHSIKVSGLQPLCFHAWPYNEDDLEKAKHPFDLPKCDFINLNIDLNIHGVGGNDSWGAKTMEKYTIDGNMPYSYGFMLEYEGNK